MNAGAGILDSDAVDLIAELETLASVHGGELNVQL
jgi:hypothetical protein